MIYRIIGFVIFALFYLFYIAKLVIQKTQSIKTNQMGVGNKPGKVLLIERIMSIATILTVVLGICSIFFMKNFLIPELRIAGIVIGIIAVIIFAMATVSRTRHCPKRVDGIIKNIGKNMYRIEIWCYN